MRSLHLARRVAGTPAEVMLARGSHKAQASPTVFSEMVDRLATLSENWMAMVGEVTISD